MFQPHFDHFENFKKELSEEWQKLAEDLIKENPDETKQKIKGLKSEICKANENVKEIEEDYIGEEQLIRFLRAANWDEKHALSMFLHHMDHARKFLPYMGGSGFPSEIQCVYEEQLVWVSPIRDSHGRRVLLLRLGRWNPDKVSSKVLYTATSHLFQMISFENKTQIAGIVIVCDLVGFGLKQLGALGLEEMRCCGDFLSGGFPLWVRRLIFINNPKVFDILFGVLNPFLGERIKNNVKFCGYDAEKLAEELPKEILPKDLHGSASDEDLNECTIYIKDIEHKLKDNLAKTEKLSRLLKK